MDSMAPAETARRGGAMILDCYEIPLGIDIELFASSVSDDELAEAARRDAAFDVLADLRREDSELAAHAERLLAATPIRRSTRQVRRVRRVVGVAA